MGPRLGGVGPRALGTFIWPLSSGPFGSWLGGVGPWDLGPLFALGLWALDSLYGSAWALYLVAPWGSANLLFSYYSIRQDDGVFPVLTQNWKIGGLGP